MSGAIELRASHPWIESSPDAYLVVGRDLVVTAANQACLDLLAAPREAIVGCPVLDAIWGQATSADRDAVRASIDRVLATGLGASLSHRAGESDRGAVVTPVRAPSGELEHLLVRVEGGVARAEIEQRLADRERLVRELSLRAEERYLLLDTAPDAMVVVGADSRIELVNTQTEKLFGYGRDELVGNRLDLLIPDRYRAGHGAHVDRYMGHPGSRPMGSGLELFGRKKDGTEIPIEVSLSPLRTAHGMTVSAAIRDVTERKRLESAARVAADRLAAAVESMQDAFALFDGADRLVLCNSVYRTLLGSTTTGPLVGRSYDAILDAWLPDLAFSSDVERARFRAERLAARRGLTASYDVRTGDMRSLRVIDRRTPEGGVVETIHDITDDVRRELELRDARTEAEAGSAAKSEFLSSMSHELRTPMNAILGFAQLLQRDKREPLSTRHRDRVDEILRGGEHLLRLIDDVLDLSRIEAGRVSISVEPVGVPEVIDEVRRTLEPLATRSHVHVAVDPMPPSLPMIEADRTRFAQILINLGSNAIKYNRPEGHVVLAVTVPSPDRVRVTVRDDGVGVPLDKQDKLFQPFQRAGQETGPIEGTGIGLVITRRLASMMRGDVGFRSVPGEGSEFWVDLPAHLGARSTEDHGPAEVATARITTSGRRVVLYVEDNQANVTFMRDLLGTYEDIELLTASSAELGIDLARARRPALIIMDINLPGMSGLEALQALRAWPETREIPVIALTAAASTRDRERGLAAGFYRYLTKPIKVDTLLEAMDALLA